MSGSVLPKIEIDEDRCTTPYDCKVCLQTCPQAVFMVEPTEVEMYKETDPEDYELIPVWRDKCVACMDCVEACPNDAITVKAGD